MGNMQQRSRLKEQAKAVQAPNRGRSSASYLKHILLTGCSLAFLAGGAHAQSNNTPGVTLGNGEPDFTTSGDITTSGTNSPNILADGFEGTITVGAGDTLTSTGDSDNASGTFPSGGIVVQDSGAKSAAFSTPHH